ncbi:MAG: Na+:solute symporter [Planctomycetes bacterium]|nr:Na+:solute symporter [Planctomycetota bacterium]
MVLWVGLAFSRRASRSAADYFVSGRSLPWWLAGTSMVATTFAADTPLVITEFVRKEGIWGNWWWWAGVPGHMLVCLVFARLWRRAEVLTDNELIELRYAGRPAAFLRGFKALYFALLYNFIVMGWVIAAMATVLKSVVGVEGWTGIWTCVAVALAYSAASGLWGVVVTDFLQFFLAVGGTVVLAVAAAAHFGGLEALVAAASAVRPAAAAMLPPASEAAVFSAAWWASPAVKTGIFLCFMWWASHGADGGGYFIQRMSATRDERHAMKATLWFAVAHYAVRFWPWVVVALASLAMFPDHQAHREGYPLVINALLGPGWRGLLVVAFLAAFMSTIDTHLNWGASYLVNDVYRRFLRPVSTQREQVYAGKAAEVGLMVVAAVIASFLTEIGRAWIFVWTMGAGVGGVLILRWFWWRITAWSEIVALATSVLLAFGFEAWAALQAGPLWRPLATPLQFGGLVLEQHHQVLIVVPCSVAAWLVATFLGPPEPRERLLAFYRRVRPGGWWGPIAHEARLAGEPVLRPVVLLQWAGGVTLVYGLLFGTGALLFGTGAAAWGCLAAAVAGGGVLWWAMQR